ncbi:putative uncharacterized protein [Clostridium sp. CAG:524]|nr:putative uncharacterized protein [Clostridium sp. CAG:524]
MEHIHYVLQINQRQVSVQLVAFHKVQCSNTNFSQSACGFVLEFADIITTHKMNDKRTNVGGWPATSMRTFVNNDIYNAIPNEIKNAIIDTTVVSGHGKSDTE